MYLPFLVDASTIYFVTPTGWGGAIHISPFNSQEDTIKDHLTTRIGGRLVFQFCKFRNVISYSFLEYNILKSNFKIHSLDNRCSMQREPQPYKNAAKHSLPLGRVLQQPFNRFGNTLGNAHCFRFEIF